MLESLGLDFGENSSYIYMGAILLITLIIGFIVSKYYQVSPSSESSHKDEESYQNTSENTNDKEVQQQYTCDGDKCFV